ncbi:MAG: DUF4249 family protein [Rikenellaceae bacterium]|nr:DUF4249 family protein [Rikenellaceae bacterium]
MKRLSVIFVFCITALCGCLKEELPEVYTQRLFVDGRIEQGRRAVVMITTNKSYDNTFSIEELRDNVVRWAKVTLTDSQQSEVLTGRIDSDYPTRFVYTSNEIIGREAESYTLHIEYSGRSWSATTTIPSPSEVISMEREWICDSLYRIRMVLPPCGNSRMVECAVGNTNYYRPALLGIVKGSTSSENRHLTVNRPINYLDIDNYLTTFHRDDSVRLRVSTMSSFGYDYWSCWENIVVNSLNPIFPPEHNPPTNISNGGRGIWCGYGSQYIRLN